MLFHKSTLVLALIMAAHSARAQMDLTPEITEYTAQGFTHRELTFKNDQQSVTFSPPQGWTIRGSKDRLQLNPPNTNLVEAVIRAAPPVASASFDEPTVKALEQQVMATEVPPNAQSVQLVARQENAIVLGSNLSFGFVLSYTTMGEKFQRSVVFVNCPQQQLIFRFSAPKTDFDKFNADFGRSVSSWQESTRPLSAGGESAPSRVAQAQAPSR